MIVILGAGATEEQIQQVIAALEQRGYGAHLSRGVERTIVGAIGILEAEQKQLLAQQLEAFPFVERVVPILKPYKLASREFHPEPTIVAVEDLRIGAEQVVVMAGPCSVESREQLLEAARAVKAAGASMLRGGAFKPSTSPYGFTGLEAEGLQLLREAKEETGLPIVTEVMDPRDVELVAECADVLQVGTRNMSNFMLLRELSRASRPVLLKRGMSSTLEEWLQAAEYIMLGGNERVILCERGIRTFEPHTRFTLDINAVPAMKQLSHLPLLVDPSHGTGRRELVAAASRAAVAAGADGLLVEVHPHPEKALKDGAQSLTPEGFAEMMRTLRPVAEAVGRRL